MNKPRVILAGGSGFLGRSLATALLARGYDVIILSRSAAPTRQEGIEQVQWDGSSPGEWAESLDGSAALVNLAGRNVNCRYTPENRREIIESRTQSVRVLGAALAGCTAPPPVWVQAASLAIYGDAGDRWCDEDAPHGGGFPARTCELWEEAFRSAQTPRIRGVLLRISFALSANGGALGMLASLARWFLGGTIGSGRQYISWIHIADLNRMFIQAIERPDLDGVFNATAPNPVTNREFMRELRRAVGRPWSPPVPSPAVRIGSWLLGTEACLALTGRRGDPKRFRDHGFTFEFPELRPALDDLFVGAEQRRSA